MRRGQPKWTVKVPSHELQAINDWIDSDANYQASDIYSRLNLVRYCCPRTFRGYVQRRRVGRRARSAFTEAGIVHETPSAAELEAALRRELLLRLHTGSAKASFLTETRLLLKELRERRANEAGGESTA